MHHQTRTGITPRAGLLRCLIQKSPSGQLYFNRRFSVADRHGLHSALYRHIELLGEVFARFARSTLSDFTFLVSYTLSYYSHFVIVLKFNTANIRRK